MGSLTRRPYHAFFSYSRKDHGIALRIHRWLMVAGFTIWFDENNLGAGVPVAATLGEQMAACQSWIVLTSKTALGSQGVTAERDQALRIAIGASAVRMATGGSPLPVFLLAHAPAGERGRTERLPFMFRDSQIIWYTSDSELLAHCRRLLMPYRRRILNYEFAKRA